MKAAIRVCLWLASTSAIICLMVFARHQGEVIATLREQVREQTNRLGELDWLREQNKATQSLRNQEAELERLREEHNELLRLRNETRQLREQLLELDMLRAANARLLQAIQNSPPLASNQTAMVVSARKTGSILGVAVRSPVSGRSGAEVTTVLPNSPVTTSGLAVGDIIYAIDGRRVESPGELQSQMLTRKAGEIVTLDVLRNEASVRIQVPTRAWPQ